MLAFISNTILMFAEAAHSGGGFAAWWSKNLAPYLSYPGFEAWRFLNLTIFVAILVFLLKKPLSEAFKAKRETIRAELIKAEEEKQAALAKLTAAEAKLAGVDNEAEEVIEQARKEAADEKSRIEREVENEIKRLRQQSENDVERKSQQAVAQLRRFSAEESVRLAEEKIKASINAANDAQLVKASIQSIGGLN